MTEHCKINGFCFDTETCGLHGLPVTMQYCYTDTPEDVTIYEFWKEPISKTLELIRRMCEEEECIIAFNLAFDWFQIVKLYNCLRIAVLCGADSEAPPEICEIAEIEHLAIWGWVLKPKHVLDIFLHARKGPYQSTMERGDITIRRVPAQLAGPLSIELERRVPLNQIYFARKEDKNAPQWTVNDSRDRETREPLEGFSDVTLKFAPSSGLKALAIDALKINPDEILYFSDVEVPKKLRPREVGYAPFHRVIKGWGAWPDVIQFHIDHWHYKKDARLYAAKDAEYTAKLYHYFGKPDYDDHDSLLAVSVANTRWRGFRLNLPAISRLRAEAVIESQAAPTDWHYVLPWIREALTETENAVVHDTTKQTLESLAKWTSDCPACGGSGCENCDEGDVLHEVAIRSRKVIAARRAEKEVELYDKLLLAGRFHASYKVIGTLSGRMAGADGLNPQGIKKKREVREAFLLADEDEVLAGGDFDSFEVVLAAAEYGDENLTADLKAGKKIHALGAMEMFSDASYDEIIASKGQDLDMYSKGKAMTFSLVYGGDEGTLERKSGLSPERASEVLNNFLNKYKKIKESRDKTFRAFCPMRQPIPGGPVIWAKPARFVESMFGFRRYYDLENKICEALYRLAENPPEEWQKWKFRVRRRLDKIQTALSAARSALYGAAFGVQAANMRSAANHKIQSAGAQVTKHVQVEIWSLQPTGIHEWRVRPMNVHDEVNTACNNTETQSLVTITVQAVVELYRDRVPLIKIDWNENMPSWAGARDD